MLRRRSARLLIVDREHRVLLFRFAFRQGALAGQDFWATPGGAVEAGETFELAATRELSEETGIVVDHAGDNVGESEFILQLPSGEDVLAQERYFLIRAEDSVLSRDGWTAEEAEVIVDHRWWTLEELAATTGTAWPANLVEMVEDALRGTRKAQ
jgi:8-oxo-dGTP diphosphatase